MSWWCFCKFLGGNIFIIFDFASCQKEKEILTDQNKRAQMRIGSDWLNVFTDGNKCAQIKIGKCGKKIGAKISRK